MVPFQYFFPTTLKFGNGLANRAGELLKPLFRGKLLVVTDEGLIKSGVLEGFFASLSTADVAYDVFSGVEANPSTTVLERAVAFLKDHACTAVIGVGGGSSIDTAKGVAAMATNAGTILDYEGYDRIPNAPLPIFAIPTTSGTGSECTASTVFTNKETLFKTVIISPRLFPQLAILDAELTLKLPPAITAATGMDALTHAIESYVSKQANPVSQALALGAVRLIGRSLRKAYYVGSDLAAREDMLLGSFLAGVAFSQSKLGNVHAISHTMGGVFNIAHGIANAALLPYVIAFNGPACPERYRDIADALGAEVAGVDAETAARRLVAQIVELNRALGIPSNIRELGVDLEHLPQMVADSMRSGNVLVNPRLTTAGDIERIILAAHAGNL
ncbi:MULTISPECIES: iron-containing alcohol dehydrogenase [Cupriavidus]|uniref:1,3-propanediol dehydrogenase n=1 Tax=Cupriavidus taiwanensis TaxID=164546 RepID=A0A375CU66_9BURK|nr:MULTISPECIES: iron-containing alcohol dehydrogenase [Cupriavidus]MEC3765521.1 iron-containing alcohol dehydrogenase [Cupriavidus sp. SS-3]SOY79537.1 1,3-propanediol dehydrogenase [Cupriavidus taiwanensis]SOY81511.1 1,3-propanediol dehydrogenase [Cupriavidus taiwanensis]SPD64757.1 1,3-propanediol dehydrogenase [Cupriavidus taiwanensis]